MRIGRSPCNIRSERKRGYADKPPAKAGLRSYIRQIADLIEVRGRQGPPRRQPTTLDVIQPIPPQWPYISPSLAVGVLEARG